MKGNGKPMDILKKLNEMAGFAPDEEIELFEVKPSHRCFLSEFILFQIFKLLRFLIYLTLNLCRKSSTNLMSCASTLIRSSVFVAVRFINFKPIEFG